MQEEIFNQDFQSRENHEDQAIHPVHENENIHKTQQQKHSLDQTYFYQHKNLAFRNVPLPQKIVTQKQISNRRYNMMIKLRQNGYFSQQAIKLRQPLLYHIYIGQYAQKTSPTYEISQQQQSSYDSQLLSQFLTKDLLNLQYKKLLSQQIHSEELEKYINSQTKRNEQEIIKLKKIGSLQKNKNFKKIKQDHGDVEVEGERENDKHTNQSMEIQQIQQELKQIQEEEQDQIINNIRQQASRSLRPQNKKRSCLGLQDYSHLQSQPIYLSQQQMSLQQQALIEECQLIFLKGQQKQFDYSKIDRDESYDNFQQINKDKQQKYFSQEKDQIQEGFQNYYTGQEDY